MNVVVVVFNIAVKSSSADRRLGDIEDRTSSSAARIRLVTAAAVASRRFIVRQFATDAVLQAAFGAALDPVLGAAFDVVANNVTRPLLTAMFSCVIAGGTVVAA